MTLFSRSCVMGRGVCTFSIWSAIAFASKTPTQIGRTRCPSTSRSTMMGMLVIGSTISPLRAISISTLRLTSSLGQNIGTAELTVNESLAEADLGGSSARLGDLDRHEAPHEVLGAVEVDDPEVAGSPGHPSPPSSVLDEDLFTRPDAARGAGAPFLLSALTTWRRRGRFSSSGTSSARRRAAVPDAGVREGEERRSPPARGRSGSRPGLVCRDSHDHVGRERQVSVVVEKGTVSRYSGRA